MRPEAEKLVKRMRTALLKDRYERLGKFMFLPDVPDGLRASMAPASCLLLLQGLCGGRAATIWFVVVTTLRERCGHYRFLLWLVWQQKFKGLTDEEIRRQMLE